MLIVSDGDLSALSFISGCNNNLEKPNSYAFMTRQNLHEIAKFQPNFTKLAKHCVRRLSNIDIFRRKVFRMRGARVQEGQRWYRLVPEESTGNVGREVLTIYIQMAFNCACALVNQTLVLAKSLKRENFTTNQITGEKYYLHIKCRAERFKRYILHLNLGSEASSIAKIIKPNHSGNM